MSRHVAIFAAIAALALGSVGCSEDSGYLEAPELRVPDCRDGDMGVFAPFELSFDLFGVSRAGGLAYFRMYEAGRSLAESDAFLLQLTDEDAVREARAESADTAFTFGAEDALVRASLSLAHTCPDSFAPIEAVAGVVRFRRLGGSTGDRVEGSVEGLTLVDSRTGEIVAEAVRGEFDFEIRGGLPYQPFVD